MVRRDSNITWNFSVRFCNKINLMNFINFVSKVLFDLLSTILQILIRFLLVFPWKNQYFWSILGNFNFIRFVALHVGKMEAWLLIIQTKHENVMKHKDALASKIFFVRFIELVQLRKFYVTNIRKIFYTWRHDVWLEWGTKIYWV